MFIKPETSFQDKENINSSSNSIWLNQIINNMSDDNEIACDPSDPTKSCINMNPNFSLPFLTIPNETEAFFNWEIMGERQDPHAAIMTFIYLVILVTGVIGNVCTCIVIARNRYMHTATNYYLFSLAVSDLLLLLLGTPQDLSHLWSKYPYPFGEVFCIIRGWCSETSTNASILTITAFTVERYLAICHPLRAHTMSRLSRAIKFIIIIWVSSALAAISMGYQLGIVYEKDTRGEDVLETATCTVKRYLNHVFEWSTGLFFILPATLLCILYALIGLQLKRSTDMGGKHDGPSSSNVNGTPKALNAHGRAPSRKSSSASRKDVIKMLVAVVIAFFFCWAPFHAQRLMAIYITEPTDEDFVAFGILTNISGVLYYISATINPILYSIMSLKFRHAFRDTLRHCLRKHHLAKHRNRNRTMSVFNSTVRSAGYELTDLTMMSEAPMDPAVNHNGGNLRKPSRYDSHLTVEKHVDIKICLDGGAVNTPLRKKTSASISNTSLKFADAFDDSTVSDYIDQMK